MHTNLNHIRLVAMDVDGVLTDGGIFIGGDGQEIKRFCAADGIGIRAWRLLGLPAAVITGRAGPAITHRLADLGVVHVMQGSKDKLADLRRLEQATSIPAREMAYVGDDWPDLPVMRAVGFAVAPINAHPIVRNAAHYITQTPGGSGAVREAIEHILKLSGRFEQALALYDGSQ